MQNHLPAPRCAPYAVYSDGKLVGRPQNLPKLYDLLLLVSERFYRTRQEYINSFRLRFPNPDVPVLWVPVHPHVEVVDARGRVRDEFSSPRKILSYFNCQPSRLGKMVDRGWDADHRPRGTPIPGTGKSTPYGRMFYRRPRTQSERRLSFVIKEDGEPAIRKSRRASGMPTFWDDLPRKGWRDRSWKRYRSHQWKLR